MCQAVFCSGISQHGSTHKLLHLRPLSGRGGRTCKNDVRIKGTTGIDTRSIFHLNRAARQMKDSRERDCTHTHAPLINLFSFIFFCAYKDQEKQSAGRYSYGNFLLPVRLCRANRYNYRDFHIFHHQGFNPIYVPDQVRIEQIGWFS
jgi:hypothetical protein